MYVVQMKVFGEAASTLMGPWAGLCFTATLQFRGNFDPAFGYRMLGWSYCMLLTTERCGSLWRCISAINLAAIKEMALMPWERKFGFNDHSRTRTR